MSINNQGFGGLMQHSVRKILLCVLTLFGVQWALSESVYAQAVQLPITYGQTIQGALGSPGDDVLPDGRPIDRYRLVTQAPGQTYAITAASLQIPVVSSVSFIDTANQQIVPLQQAQVFLPGQQVLYAGRLPQPGTYIINVFSPDTQRPLGGYTLSLSCLDDNGGDDNGIDDDLDDQGDCPGGAANNLTPPSPTPGLGDDRGFDDNGGDDNGGDDDNGGGDDNGGEDDDGSDG